MLTRKELIEKLTQLEIEKKSYTRLLDRYYYDQKKRSYYFNLLKKAKDEIPKVKFQLRLIKEMKNNAKNRNTNSTNN